MLDKREAYPVLIQIPVSATYRIENSDAVLLNAEYIEVQANLVAQFLAGRFHIPFDSDIIPFTEGGTISG